MQEGNKNLGMLRGMLFKWKIFTLTPINYYITIDFKKLVSYQFHAGSAVVESECIRRKTRLSECSLKT